MCVRFSGQPDEVGFIMLHVDINQHSPSLVFNSSIIIWEENWEIIWGFKLVSMII